MIDTVKNAVDYSNSFSGVDLGLLKNPCMTLRLSMGAVTMCFADCVTMLFQRTTHTHIQRNTAENICVLLFGLVV